MGAISRRTDVWNAQVSKRLSPEEGRALSVYLQVANLTDTRDLALRRADGSAVPGDFQIWIAPRTFQAGLTLDLDWLK